jgi:hypothetical protein
MTVTICAVAASANHVQVFLDVCSWAFVATATAAINDTNAMSMRGASRNTNAFAWTSPDRAMAAAAKEGADSFIAVVVRTAEYRGVIGDHTIHQVPDLIPWPKPLPA